MVEAVRDCIIGSNESRGAYARPHMVPAFAGLRKGAIQAAMQAMHGLLSGQLSIAVWPAVCQLSSCLPAVWSSCLENAILSIVQLSAAVWQGSVSYHMWYSPN